MLEFKREKERAKERERGIETVSGEKKTNILITFIAWHEYSVSACVCIRLVLRDNCTNSFNAELSTGII